MRVRDKIALVTGAASGIGRAVTEVFAKEGASVFAADIVTPKAPYPERVRALTLGLEQWLR